MGKIHEGDVIPESVKQERSPEAMGESKDPVDPSAGDCAESTDPVDPSAGDRAESREPEVSVHYYTYMVRCADGTLYTGWTTDLTRRVAAHNRGMGAKYTKPRRPVKLVYFEESASKEEAMSREWHWKRLTKAEKEKMICGWEPDATRHSAGS